MYKCLIKKILFLFHPETAHNLVMMLLGFPLLSKMLGRIYRFEHPSLERKLFGLTFKNPLGLAAGFDKNAERFSQLADLGFGFVEIGTVTPRPQPGNPQPRLFRLPQDQALINRMGFNNEGVEAIADRLRGQKGNLLIGGNIGKNKTTSNKDALKDYEICFQALYDVVDYFVVNISSPNTPNLRELQDKEPLTRLLGHLKTLNQAKLKEKPILLKIAPDLNDSQLDDIVDIVRKVGIEGIIATNTTISRGNLRTAGETVTEIGNGGLSGKPLTQRATEVIRYLHQKSGGTIPIIGVGGIHSPEDALEKIAAGASLIQLYTGLVYRGPGLIRCIKKALVEG
jgi:dihydroorotate dehydrogenase